MTIQINELVIRAEILKQATNDDDGKQTYGEPGKVIEKVKKKIMEENKNKRER